jgi:hypothetical protein
MVNQKHFRRIHLLVEDHRYGPNRPLRGEEIAQKARQSGWKALPQRQRRPVKKGVSFDEVCKPRKQLCFPPLNLDTAPLFPRRESTIPVSTWRGSLQPRTTCRAMSQRLHTGLYHARCWRVGRFVDVTFTSALVGAAFVNSWRPRLASLRAARYRGWGARDAHGSGTRISRAGGGKPRLSSSWR